VWEAPASCLHHPVRQPWIAPSRAALSASVPRWLWSRFSTCGATRAARCGTDHRVARSPHIPVARSDLPSVRSACPSGVHRIAFTAHERTTPGEDVIRGEGHLWQNGECVAAVHYLLVGSANSKTDATCRVTCRRGSARLRAAGWSPWRRSS